jgi:hypothetical protein
MVLHVTKRTVASLAVAVALCAVNAPAAGKHGKSAPVTPDTGAAVFWTEPADLPTRDLFYGPGGKEHEPQGPFKFEKEELDGTNPKFVVKDAAGTKWKVKLGLEARPETTATRLVWAAGYYVNEDYFLRDMQIEGMPVKLHRGAKLVGPNGTVHNVRLKREPKDQKKIGTWTWDAGPYTGTREWNGLRTLMALINNWDLKDENNAIYKIGSQRVYMVSDLGATFGSAGRTWPREKAKDNLDSYSRSRFIRRATRDLIDFDTPARPRWVYWVNPKEYLSRVRLEHIGKGVPRADAKWLGQLMTRLSPEQLHDAFRAGGYSQEEIDAFSRILQNRISVLTDL